MMATPLSLSNLVIGGYTGGSTGVGVINFYNYIITYRKMLIDAREYQLIIHLKKNLQEKEKKINIMTIFFISHKSGVKTFLKLIVNYCTKRTYQHKPNL